MRDRAIHVMCDMIQLALKHYHIQIEKNLPESIALSTSYYVSTKQ